METANIVAMHMTKNATKNQTAKHLLATNKRPPKWAVLLI